MALNPKLEFYRFSLNHKDEKLKTFQNFAVNELNDKKSLSDKEVTKLIFEHFVKSLTKDIARDDKLKKQVTLNTNSEVNIHHSHKPTFQAKNNLIYGVINGGSYGKDRIVAESKNPDKENSKLDRDKTVLSYYFFMLYIPYNHSEGCFAIHSNSREDSISDIFRGFIARLFQGVNYNMCKIEVFCPKSFQEKYKEDLVINSIRFKSSTINEISSEEGINQESKRFDLKIEFIPEDKNSSIADVTKVVKSLRKKLFGTKENLKSLEDYDVSFEAKNKRDKSTKTFDLELRDKEIVPVFLLKDKISRKNADGTPDFTELKEVCLDFFDSEVLPEIRPDYDVISIK